MAAVQGAGPIPYIEQIVQSALQLNVAVPVVFTLAISAAKAWKAMFGEEVDLGAVAIRVEHLVKENEVRGLAEIERLKAKLADTQ